ncbi:hypothetical protein [Roseiarcus sp.]|uniref:hypothetical protein n=1 Tax=Roseiarcus sp. TaxID=1969460 RepID=UPI003F945190
MKRRSRRRRADAGRVAAAALVLGVAGLAALAGEIAAQPSCGNVRLPLDVSIGGTPVATLDVGGRRGAFLIDTGATLSAVDAKSYGLVPGSRVDRKVPFCSPARIAFRAEDMGAYRAPAGKQRGRIGTDLLGSLAVVFSYGESPPSMTVRTDSPNPASLTATGLVEVGWRGRTRPAPRETPASNGVPVIALAIGPVMVPAQLDTGFDDVDDPGILQGNAALLTALRDRGVAMRPAPSAGTLGCAGVRAYPRWRIEAAGLAVIAADGTRAATYPPPLIEIKDDVGCVGIAASAEPFAQIGASWLGRWRTTILDGSGGEVWIPR